MAFRFSLAKVLDWYDRRYKIESDSLQNCIERVVQAQRKWVSSKDARAQQEAQSRQLQNLSGLDLAALEKWRVVAIAKEARLQTLVHAAERERDDQRLRTTEAQRKLRLVERLRDRKRSESDYILTKQLEELANDSHLAAFSRQLAASRQDV